MRFSGVFVLLLLLLAAPAFAQQPAKPAAGGAAPPAATPTRFQSLQYQVEMTAPAGWRKVFDEPQPAGSWLNLAKFEEPRTGASVTLSFQAITYRTSQEMFDGLRKQFRGDTSLGILRDETRTATGQRPEGIFFEYTFQEKGAAQHAVAAYWLHMGKRYRVYGLVKEAAWRTVGGDFENMVASVALTGRAFSESPHNFRDEPENFEIFLPETFTIRLPEKGPRVVFTSQLLAASVWIHVGPARGTLEESLAAIVAAEKEAGADVKSQTRPETHPTIGVPACTFEYEKKEEKVTYRYRETVIVQRERLYRFVLAAADSAFAGAEDPYNRIVRSVSFLR